MHAQNQHQAAVQHDQHHSQQPGGESLATSDHGQQHRQLQASAPGQNSVEMTPAMGLVQPIPVPSRTQPEQPPQSQQQQPRGGDIVVRVSAVQAEPRVHEQQQPKQPQQCMTLAQIAALPPVLESEGEGEDEDFSDEDVSVVFSDDDYQLWDIAPPKPSRAAVAAAAAITARKRYLGSTPLRRRAPAETFAELGGNLELIRKEYAENMAVAAESGKEHYLPTWEMTSQLNVAVGIELWLLNHAANFNAEDLEEKRVMLQGIQNRCTRGELDNMDSRAVKIDALACWVELTKSYYIIVRESRNLRRRGVKNITEPNFRLPENPLSIPHPRSPDDGIPTADLDVAHFSADLDVVHFSAELAATSEDQDHTEIEEHTEIETTKACPNTRAARANWILDRITALPEIWAIVASHLGLVETWRLMSVCRSSRAG